MSLTVEDGTLVAGADSYVTLAEFQSYAANRGWTLRGTDPEDEIDVRRAFDVVNRQWQYIGDEVGAQVGAWPRSHPDFDANEIPQQIKDAQCEVAYLIRGGLNPLATVKGVVKSAGAGPARTEFLGGLSTPRLVAVEGLLRRYLAVGQGQVRVVRG